MTDVNLETNADGSLKRCQVLMPQEGMPGQVTDLRYDRYRSKTGASLQGFLIERSHLKGGKRIDGTAHDAVELQPGYNAMLGLIERGSNFTVNHVAMIKDAFRLRFYVAAAKDGVDLSQAPGFEKIAAVMKDPQFAEALQQATLLETRTLGAMVQDGASSAKEHEALAQMIVSHKARTQQLAQH